MLLYTASHMIYRNFQVKKVPSWVFSLTALLGLVPLVRVLDLGVVTLTMIITTSPEITALKALRHILDPTHSEIIAIMNKSSKFWSWTSQRHSKFVCQIDK